ncbi:Ig-like domain-containing protein [Oceanithermus desulfurans]|uniref:SbsA Ig-like domain-containing protein n=2 Tax=Oceanithermus desulfurans TaxID=227924 RepID=A0A511RLP4_9DEIN|nr:Ig-like domain-containing protein [Oceanithermus desulfurans]MBB6030855.1 hypothetical protein [Oceanithermus desulfurans]GEM90570.1 hypothetical protein ODE01S_20040 [Oceanithermus desulfurans NBRC 100063]
MRIRWWMLLTLFLTACGTQEPPAPQVNAFYPPDGYHGFKKDESLRIAFNEPMDPATTEAAFQLLGPAGAPVAVSFTWEDGGRRLKITPANPLAYSPDSSYQSYRYLLSTGARSQRGTPLESDLDVSFTTMRTLTEVRDAVAALDGAVSSAGFVYNDPNDPSAYTTARTGDTVADKGLRSFFAFDLSGLDVAAEDVAFARLDLYNTALRGAPFGPGNLGNLVTETVDYLDDDQLDAGDYALAAGRILGTVASWGSGVHVNLDVDEGLKDALDASGAYLQLRLRFENESNGDGSEDSVNPATGEDTNHPPRLTVGYYAP